MFENLTESAIESIEGARPGPSNPVKVVLKHISEGRKLHYDQVSSDHLISTIRYLLDAFGWVKRRISEDGSPELVWTLSRFFSFYQLRLVLFYC